MVWCTLRMEGNLVQIDVLLDGIPEKFRTMRARVDKEWDMEVNVLVSSSLSCTGGVQKGIPFTCNLTEDIYPNGTSGVLYNL
jgi:hypothetical protein